MRTLTQNEDPRGNPMALSSSDNANLPPPPIGVKPANYLLANQASAIR
jgi:hypothetical protein